MSWVQLNRCMTNRKGLQHRQTCWPRLCGTGRRCRKSPMTVTKRLSAPTRPSQNSPNIKKRSGNKSRERDFWLGLCILFHGLESMWSVRVGTVRRYFGKVRCITKNKPSALYVTVDPDLKTLAWLSTFFCFVTSAMNSWAMQLEVLVVWKQARMLLKSKSCQT